MSSPEYEYLDHAERGGPVGRYMGMCGNVWEFKESLAEGMW
jgi:hypothetical protein